MVEIMAYRNIIILTSTLPPNLRYLKFHAFIFAKYAFVMSNYALKNLNIHNFIWVFLEAAQCGKQKCFGSTKSMAKKKKIKTMFFSYYKC